MTYDFKLKAIYFYGILKFRTEPGEGEETEDRKDLRERAESVEGEKK